jgi:uncharacterized HAD superfamily protein
MADVEKKLQELSDEYQTLQTRRTEPSNRHVCANSTAELTTNVQAREKLESQQQENKGVQQVLHSFKKKLQLGLTGGRSSQHWQTMRISTNWLARCC